MGSNQLTTKSILMWAGAALGITVIIVGAVKLASSGDTPNASGGKNANLAPVSEIDQIQGATTSPITLIEYSDFQCPACASYHPLVEQVVSEYEGQILFVYRHFPLTQHQQAEEAAYAAEAAGKQGDFWGMYDLIFENQREWSGKNDAPEIFEEYAETLGLDIEQYRTDVNDSAIIDKVRDDFQGGTRAGVNSTPTFYLNGEKIRNPSSLNVFKKLIDAQLATTT